MGPRIHPHDVGLPEPVVRKRRRSRRRARIMLTIALLTAGAGWALFFSSIIYAVRIKDQPFSLAIIAYGLLIVSSVTLVLGLWYMLVAQMARAARTVELGEEDAGEVPKRCGNCGWGCDPPDRFCRHCGKPLGASSLPRESAGQAA